MSPGSYALSGFNVSLESSNGNKFWTYLTSVVQTNYKFTIANMAAGERYRAAVQSFNSLHASAWSQQTNYASTSMVFQFVCKICSSNIAKLESL